jgi:hypothetical protein
LSKQGTYQARFLKKEVALLATMLFLGLVLLPIAIWFVGNAIFGTSGGTGYSDFFGSLSGKIRAGDPAAWFLVLSPWLGVQVVRLAVAGWRHARKV